MWVKICANTTVADTLAAIHLGADAVGFVFAPSKRQVTPAEVRAITSALPPGTECVGVFPGWSAERIAEAAGHAGLTAVQLHAGFDPARTNRLHALAPRLEILEVAHWTVGDDPGSREAVEGEFQRLRQGRPGVSQRVLVDAKVDSVSGGTGIPFDWRGARPVFAAAEHELRLILAGGLRPENVHDAVRTLHPFGVDVASGVESQPGKKDLVRLRQFIERARAAEGDEAR